MKWVFRQLKDEETDYELVFGVLFVPVYLLIVFILTRSSMEWAPICSFHEATGIPCPTCGAFRSICFLTSGRIPEAWLTQPMIITLVFLGLIYSLYSCIVVIGRLPRLRVENVSGWIRWGLLFTLAALFLGNWAYLMITSR